jgi:hypothetical protein
VQLLVEHLLLLCDSSAGRTTPSAVEWATSFRELDGRNLSTKETIFLLLMDAQNKFSMKSCKLTRNVMISRSTALLFTALQLKADGT